MKLRFHRLLAPSLGYEAANPATTVLAGADSRFRRPKSNRLLKAAIHQPGMVVLIEGQMQWLQDSIKALEKQIDNHIDRHPRLREDALLITRIAGLGTTTAAKGLADLDDVNRPQNARTPERQNAKALAAFVGVTPKIKALGRSVRGRSVIARSGHAAVRHALYMPAMVVLKYKPLMKVFAERLQGDGLAPKAVIAACMHQLIRQIDGVLKSRNAFDATFWGPSAWLSRRYLTPGLRDYCFFNGATMACTTTMTGQLVIVAVKETRKLEP